ncbi:MAG: hypothetical protein K1X79_08065 [Oligoflexia bacterium]|nr:hypothetical protein [Oligoflexia bacterium]
MSCYSCGSPRGESFKLCPECIAKRKLERANVRAEALGRYRNSKPDQVERVIDSAWAKVLAIIALAGFLFVYLLKNGPLSHYGSLASLLFAGMLSCFAIATFVWALLWTKMVIFDTMWAIASLLIPCLVYRYVYLRWDESDTRKYFFTHAATLITTVILCYALSVKLDISMYDTARLYHFYTSGQNPVLTPEGILAQHDEYANETENVNQYLDEP